MKLKTLHEEKLWYGVSEPVRMVAAWLHEKGYHVIINTRDYQAGTFGIWARKRSEEVNIRLSPDFIKPPSIRISHTGHQGSAIDINLGEPDAFEQIEAYIKAGPKL